MSAEGQSIEIVLGEGADLPRLYANHLLVSHTNRDFVLAFADFEPPLSPAQQEHARSTNQFPARVVAKLVVAPSFVPLILGALQTNWNRYLEETQGGDDPAQAGRNPEQPS